MTQTTAARPRVGLVLSGGGVRGAYAVGAVAGIAEVLGLRAPDPAPFQVFTGSSVGAINASFLAAHTHRGDMAVERLAALWQSMQLNVHFRLELRDLARRAGVMSRLIRRELPAERGWSALDVAPLQRLVEDGIDWSALRDNVHAGRTHALIVPALDIATGRTTMFADLAPDAEFRPSPDPLRTARYERIDASHVLASAAIPGLFPARRIGEAYYCDGGLRFNTPLAPAIRAGADRLVIVSLLRRARPLRKPPKGPAYPGLTFLMGKLLNALLADPVNYDLQILDRFNRVVEVLESSLAPDDLERVQRVLVDTRGARYRRLESLVIRPSKDIGVLAGDYLRRSRTGRHVDGVEGWMLRYMRARTHTREADWASYVLFDGGFAEILIELGRRDARARADDIRRFFDAPAPASPAAS